MYGARAAAAPTKCRQKPIGKAQTREMVDSPDMAREPDSDEDYELSDEHNPDHDLSDWGLRWDSQPDSKPWFARRGFLLVVAFLVIASLMLPPLIVIL